MWSDSTNETLVNRLVCCPSEKRVCGDRYIPSRQTCDFSSGIGIYDRPDDMSLKNRKDILHQGANSERLETYKKLMRCILRLPDPSHPVLNYWTTAPERKERRERDWPVKPRKLPCLKAPLYVLDLPNFSSDRRINIVDWGPAGLASALENTVFIWNEPHEVKTLKDCSNSEDSMVTAVKWDKSGNLLAVGTTQSNIQVWYPKKMEKLEETWCLCAVYGGCVIAALTWHPQTNSLVSGCSNGVLRVCSYPGVLIAQAVIDDLPSLNRLEFSADGNFLAGATYFHWMKVWTWPALKLHSEIVEISSCKAFAWHPWMNSLLAFGSGSRSLQIWNMKKKKIVASCTTAVESRLVAITWSSLTGELVLSFQVNHTGGNDYWSTEILILSSIDKVVDKICLSGTIGFVQYIFWSPDGYKLATAGSDESLRIWEFLGTKKLSKKKYDCILRYNRGTISHFNHCSTVIR